MTLILRIAVNAIALWVAGELIDGITLSDQWGSVLLVAIIFGLVNAVLKPIAVVLTFPVLIVTLGLFTLIINAVMLSLTDALSSGLEVEGFSNAVLGALVISVVSWALSIFVPDDRR